MASETILAEPVLHTEPFPFFTAERSFDEETCLALEETFSAPAEWQTHNEELYNCFLREITAELPASLLAVVVERMRNITTLPLTDRVVVTAQRMDPGQAVGIHSDRPLPGYEIARLVVQLNHGWRPEHGGVLNLHQSPELPASRYLKPLHNCAFGFVLHEASHHAVTQVSQERRSVVFNFWHVANTEATAAFLRAWLSDMKFGLLPEALDPIATAAESTLPESTTFRASVAAWVLHRLGYEDGPVVDAYRLSAGLVAEPLTTELDEVAAVRLAVWVALLHTGSFHLEGWEVLDALFKSTGPCRRLSPVASQFGLCTTFQSGSGSMLE